MEYTKEKILELRKRYEGAGCTAWISDQALIEFDKLDESLSKIEYDYVMNPYRDLPQDKSNMYIAGIDPYDEDAITDVQYLTASEVMARFEEYLTPQQKECIEQQLAAVQKNVKG